MVVPTALTIAITTTANGSWTAQSGGFTQFRIISSAWTSGTATVALAASPIPHTPIVAVVGTAAGLSLNTTGNVAHGSAVAGNPMQQATEARTTDNTAVGSGTVVRNIGTVLGKQIFKLDAIPDLSWNYAAAAGGLVTTGGVTAKAAAGSGTRNYVKSAQVINSHATISTEVLIRDGAGGTVLHRGWAQAAGGGYSVHFDPPLRGTANTLVEIAEVSATATAGVLVNLQGYVAAE
jgi:hypothetical protein